MFGNIIKIKIPKLLVGRRNLLITIPIAPGITHPHIKAPIRQHKAERLVLIINNKSIRAIPKSMLQINNFLIGLNGRVLCFKFNKWITLDSEKFQIYIVVGVDYVRLDGVVHVGAVLGEAEFCLGGTEGEREETE